jgi:hypothetical protein
MTAVLWLRRGLWLLGVKDNGLCGAGRAMCANRKCVTTEYRAHLVPEFHSAIAAQVKMDMDESVFMYNNSKATE